MRWLTLPVPIVRAFIAQLPRLEAREALHSAAQTALGSGSLQRGKAREIERRWQRQAEGPRERQPATTQSVWGGLASMGGVKVITVPAKTSPASEG